MYLAELAPPLTGNKNWKKKTGGNREIRRRYKDSFKETRGDRWRLGDIETERQWRNNLVGDPWTFQVSGPLPTKE